MSLELKRGEMEAIKSSFLFEGANELACGLSEGCEAVSYKRGEMIYTPSEFRRALGIILSGNVRVTKSAGGREKVINVLGAGRSFGVAALFGERESYVTTLEAEARTRVLFMDQEVIKGLIESDSRIALNYIRFLSDRICFLNSRIGGLLTTGAESAAAGRILSDSRDGGVFTPADGYSSMAESLNISRASLYRAFDSMEEKGAIKKSGSTITIVDRFRLEQISTGGSYDEKDI